MGSNQVRLGRVAVTAVTMAVVVAAWAVAAWISRDVRPWAIRWTTVCVVVFLLTTYLSTCLIAITWAKNRRLMSFRVVTVTMVLLIMLLVLDAAAWFKVINYRTMSSVLFDERSNPNKLFVDDPQLFYRRPANFSWSGRPRSDMAREFNLPIRAPRRQTFTTDSKGFRNSRDLTRADIVLIGDSYIEGLYVSDDETAAVTLEHAIGRPVANLGTAGYGTLQQLVVLDQFAFPLQPELVAWFFFEGNDLYDDHGFEAFLNGEHKEKKKKRKRGGTPSRWQEFRKISFTANASDVVHMWLHPLFPKTVPEFGWFRDKDGRHHRMYYYDYATLELTDYELERFETTKSTLRRGAELCREHGVQLVVFYIPMKFRVYGELCQFPPHSPCVEWCPWNLSEQFLQFCAEEGIDCVDLVKPMRQAAAADEVLYAPEDSHWNKEGHEFVARQVELLWRARERELSRTGAGPAAKE